MNTYKTDSLHTEHQTYIAIDLKSFYASVECVERGLNPLDTNLVVADSSRTDKTICLAVSPSLKSYGISGRPRLFEVVQKVEDVNRQRLRHIANDSTTGKSYIQSELLQHPSWKLDYIVAKPRMSRYMEVSTKVYEVYLSFFAAEDIHVYSVDEVFIDATQYLNLYKKTAKELTSEVIKCVLDKTGITATAGIGTNIYLSKVAMDIVAKHIPADSNGVRIAELDEMSYRRQLWNHTPLTSFWRVGRGTARTLERYGLDSMGKVARCSLTNEELLYKLFGVHAELLIDHAWGWEPCTIADIKSYHPSSHSLSNGQVLSEPYTKAKAAVVMKEMAETMALQLMRRKLITDQIIIDIGFDRATLQRSDDGDTFAGDISKDRYGRTIPKHVHGSANLQEPTAVAGVIMQTAAELFDKIVRDGMLIRRLNITANHILSENSQPKHEAKQLELFDAEPKQQEAESTFKRDTEKERRVQQTILDIKNSFGKNAILRGLNFRDGATARERNQQIGGHKA